MSADEPGRDHGMDGIRIVDAGDFNLYPFGRAMRAIAASKVQDRDFALLATGLVDGRKYEGFAVHRHPDPKLSDRGLWDQDNISVAGIAGCVHAFAEAAGKAVSTEDGRMTVIELNQAGWFAWRIGDWGEACFVRMPGVSAHETLSAIEAFQERRKLHGDGHSTHPDTLIALDAARKPEGNQA